MRPNETLRSLRSLRCSEGRRDIRELSLFYTSRPGLRDGVSPRLRGYGALPRLRRAASLPRRGLAREGRYLDASLDCAGEKPTFLSSRDHGNCKAAIREASFRRCP